MTIPLPLSNEKQTFDSLVKDISQLLGKGGIDSDHVDHIDILELMRQYTSDRSEWGPLVSSWSIEGEPYTRNLIDSGNGSYNLVRRL
jgi:cysteine dioxygenase